MSQPLSENVDFVARLLTQIYSEKKDFALALDELKQEENLDVQSHLRRLEELYAEHQSWSKACEAWAPNHPLNLLLQDKNLTSSRLAAVSNALLSKDQVFTTITTQLILNLSYLLVLLVLVTLIQATMNLYVLPQFKEVFESFGSELPSFSLFTLKFSNVLTVLLILLTILLFIVSFSLKKAQRLNHKPSWIVRLIPPVAAIYSNSQKLERTIADFAYPKHSESTDSDQEKRIALAEKFAIGDQEVALITSDLLSEFERKALFNSRLLTVTVQLLVVYTVASLLIAFYLPIFQLGVVQ